MRRVLQVLACAGMFAVGSPAMAADEVTVSELIINSIEWDGRVVALEGELIGDYGFRDDGSMWTQLNGDTYAQVPLLEGGARGGNAGVGVRIPTELADGLDPPGGYRNRGPIVRLIGTWAHHDQSRHGETFLRVESLEVLESGRPLSQQTNWLTISAGLMLVAVASFIWLTTPKE